MTGAVNVKETLYLYVGGALLCDIPRYVSGGERDFRIAFALENLLVHLLVARVIAALAAGRIHNDFAAGVARPWVECDAATFQFESAVNCVQNIPQCPLDVGLSGIKIDRDLLCRY